MQLCFVLSMFGVAQRGANKTPRPGNKILRVYLMYDYETSDLFSAILRVMHGKTRNGITNDIKTHSICRI